MSFQFARFEIYAQKATSKRTTAEAVCLEAARVKGWCSHIESPRPPNVLYGDCPSAAMKKIREKIEFVRGNCGRGRGIRKDTRILGGIVISREITFSDLSDNEIRDEYLAWRKLVLQFLIVEGQRLGMTLLTVVEHSDEQFMHVHALYMANNSRLDMKLVHPGFLAKHQVDQMIKANIDPKISKNSAFKAAMRAWQDHVYDQVSAPSGLLRFGPQRTRYSADVFKARVAEAKAMAGKNSQLKSATEQTRRERSSISQARSEIEAERTKLLKVREDLLNFHRTQRARVAAINAVCNGEIVGAYMGKLPNSNFVVFGSGTSRDRQDVLLEELSPALNEALKIIIKMTEAMQSGSDKMLVKGEDDVSMRPTA